MGKSRVRGGGRRKENRRKEHCHHLFSLSDEKQILLFLIICWAPRKHTITFIKQESTEPCLTQFPAQGRKTLSQVSSGFLKAADLRLIQSGIKSQLFLLPAQWPYTSQITSLSLTLRIYNTSQECDPRGLLWGLCSAWHTAVTTDAPVFLLLHLRINGLFHPWATQSPCEVERAGITIPIS